MQSGVNVSSIKTYRVQSQYEMNDGNYWRLDNNNEIKGKPLFPTKYSRTSLSSILFHFHSLSSCICFINSICASVHSAVDNVLLLLLLCKPISRSVYGLRHSFFSFK